MAIDKNRVRAWQDGLDGFLLWLKDFGVMVPNRQGGFSRFEPYDYQLDCLREALKRDDRGRFHWQTILITMPRRHGKTLLAALLVTWRFTTRPGENIVTMANTERQATSVSFRLVRSIIQKTPALHALIGPKNVRATEILLPQLNSRIIAVPTAEAGLYGEKITVGWVSELHAATSDAALQILASSLGDSLDSWLLVDSTTDPIGGPLHRLEQLAETGEDPSIFVYRREYTSLEDALENSPPHLSRKWLKSRHAQLKATPAVFASQHLNRRSQSQNNLFQAVDLEACTDTYQAPVNKDGTSDLVDGRAYAVGGGLDRALSFSLHGDSTIWTSVLKTSADSGEPEYWLLNQKKIGFSQGRAIKRAILDDHEAYSLRNLTIEQYQSADLAAWAQDQGVPCEMTHATSKDQAGVFVELARIIQEHRLHIPANCPELIKEMQTFVYEISSARYPKFGALNGLHDDRVYSLAWAVWSLRDNELAAYELPRVVCTSKSPHAEFCYLRSGDLQLLCAPDCEAHRRVEAMYHQHRQARLDTELTLIEFFQRKVKLSGARVYQHI